MILSGFITIYLIDLTNIINPTVVTSFTTGFFSDVIYSKDDNYLVFIDYSNGIGIFKFN